MRTSNSRHLPSSSSPLVARFDWRVASLLRQLHAQILGEGTSSSSSLISPTLFSILIGVQSPDSSFLVLSSFRLPHTEELLLKSTALSSSSRSLSPLEEALCRDLLTLSSLLPRGLQILGLLFHNASSLSSEKNFSSLQSTPGPDGEKKAEGGKEGKKKEHYDHVAGKNVHAFSPLSGVSLLKKCVDLLNQTEDLGFCLDFPRGEGKRYGGCKRKTQHGGEEEKDFFCLLGRLPSSSSSSSLSSSSMSDGVDAEEQQLRIKESIVDACLATPSSTDAIPWIFSTVLFSSLNKSFTSSSSSSSLSCSLPFPKISVEDGASILKTEKSVFLRSQITFEFSFDLPYAVKKRVEPGRCDGCGKNGWKRQDGERDEGSSGRTDKLIDKHEGRDNEEAVSAEGEDLEDFLVEMSPSLGEEILHQLRRQEEMITKSPKSLFFCMPNGVYVHPTGDDLEEEDEMDVRKRDDEKRKKPSKKDDETPHTLWSAVCTAAKKCGSSVAISSSSPANNSSLSLPWFEQEKNNTSTTSTQKTLSSSSSSIPFSLSSLSVLPIPAFLNSVSLLEYGSETRSYDDRSPPLPSDSECMYTPVRCTTTYPSSPPSDKNRRGKNDSFKSLAAVGMESKLDVCIFMPGSASLTSVANALRFAFLCQIRQLGLEIASSIICRNERKEEEQHQGDIIMMNGENLISGVSPAQAAGEVIFSSNFPDVSEDPSLLFSFPLLPRFLSPLSPSFCHNDQDSLQLQGDREKKSKTTSSSRGNCSGVTTPQGEKTSSQTRLNGTESDLSSLYQSITSTTGLISLNFSLIRTLHACHPFVLGGYLHSRTLRRRWIEVIGNGKISPALRPSAVVPWNECERYASGKL
ncbi:peptidase family c78 protein, partial [Cystoisospora suis]